MDIKISSKEEFFLAEEIENSLQKAITREPQHKEGEFTA